MLYCGSPVNKAMHWSTGTCKSVWRSMIKWKSIKIALTLVFTCLLNSWMFRLVLLLLFALPPFSSPPPPPSILTPLFPLSRECFGTKSEMIKLLSSSCPTFIMTLIHRNTKCKPYLVNNGRFKHLININRMSFNVGFIPPKRWLIWLYSFSSSNHKCFLPSSMACCSGEAPTLLSSPLPPLPPLDGPAVPPYLTFLCSIVLAPSSVPPLISKYPSVVPRRQAGAHNWSSVNVTFWQSKTVLSLTWCSSTKFKLLLLWRKANLFRRAWRWSFRMFNRRKRRWSRLDLWYPFRISFASSCSFLSRSCSNSSAPPSSLVALVVKACTTNW